VGHGEDHVRVAAVARDGDPERLENAILTVRRLAIDESDPERVTGEILEVDPAPRIPRAALPVHAGSPALIGGVA
jgi:hypothetical protein